MNIGKIISRLKEKNILTKLSIYGASTWLFIQINHTISPYLGLPQSYVLSIIWSAILIAPLLITYLWMSSSQPQVTDPAWIHKAYVFFYKVRDSMNLRIGIIASIITSTFIVIFLGGSAKVANNISEAIEENTSTQGVQKMAVLHFNNLTGKEDLKVIGPMTAHWLTEGFIQSGDLKIVSTNAVQKVYKESSLIPDIDIIKKLVFGEIGASHAIDGSYFVQGDSIFITCQLIESTNNEVVYSFGTFASHMTEPLKAIVNLREKVLGYWYNRENISRFPPPRYDAYKKFIEAQSIWGEDDDKVLSLLQESIALDNSFYEPRFLELALYRNANYYSYCDSIIDVLSDHKSQLTKAQLDKVYFFKSELNGQYTDAYGFLKNEYDRDPQDLFMNTSTGNFAMSNLNDPTLAIDLMKEINLNSLDYNGCHYCQTRLYTTALAELRLNNDPKVRKLIALDSKLNADTRIDQLDIISLIKLSKDRVLISKLQDTKVNNGQSAYLRSCILASTEYFKILKEEQAKEIIVNAISQIGISQNLNADEKELLAMLYEMNGDFAKAVTIYNELLELYPNTKFYQYRQLTTLSRLNQIDGVEDRLNQLFKTKPKYDFGYTYYEMARVHLANNDIDTALDNLKKSVDEGRLFYLTFFDRDWYLKELWDNPEFEKLLKSRRITPIVN